MHQGRVDLVILGADRIAGNGDTANKIGTYSLAVLARHHGIPFYVAAPLSTFDFSIPDGGHIPVEERAPEEVTWLYGKEVAPAAAPALNLAFDVTPNELISGIITEAGIAAPPYAFQPQTLEAGIPWGNTNSPCPGAITVFTAPPCPGVWAAW
jgi:methylthioribose-1-phosphate isomerase